jgi:hypothetical protein
VNGVAQIVACVQSADWNMPMDATDLTAGTTNVVEIPGVESGNESDVDQLMVR